MLNIIQVLRFEDTNDANNVRATNRTFGEYFATFDTGDLEKTISIVPELTEELFIR